jgi:hypothetical protein
MRRMTMWLGVAMCAMVATAGAQPGRGGPPSGGERPARPDPEQVRETVRERRGEGDLPRADRGDRGDRGERGGPPGERLRGRGDGDGLQPPRGGDPTARRLMEQRIRERFGEVVRRQLSLDDGQFSRLRETNREFEGLRRDLGLRERSARMTIRDELERGDAADDARVNSQMQELLKLQRERLALNEREDAKLGEFLSPAQRAKYFGLQDQLRRRVDEMRRRAMSGGGPPPD